MNLESKDVRDFFLKKNLRKFDKDQNRIFELCVYHRDCKDTGICGGLIYPIKDWNKHLEKKV